jgi:nitrogen fixation-related uncharacterized protein
MSFTGILVFLLMVALVIGAVAFLVWTLKGDE